jgi:hypothetical protein
MALRNLTAIAAAKQMTGCVQDVVSNLITAQP